MSASLQAVTPSAVLLRVSGVVQGVGFRPFVHRLASRYGLDGWIRNVTGEVEIALEGDGRDIRRFVHALRIDAPPLARIDAVREAPLDEQGLGSFRVLESTRDATGRQLVPPDVAVCAECTAELYDPRNRRHGYPFITCTNCGPRYSVIEAMPYDRERTSMRWFAQCAACRAEYLTMGNRRYHSETNSCPRCGPRLELLTARPMAAAPDPIEGASRVLRQGGIVALRGIGGFHLAADATNQHAVARLRDRKHRDGKPLAIMVRALADARSVAHVSEREADWLVAPERPIVLLRRRDDPLAGPIAPSVSDGLDTIGVMLPYAPLQMLLLDAVGRPLVMTSGNRSHEPLTASVGEALHDLGGIADAFVTHDREIVARSDDSVLRVAGDTTILMRRGRGFAPVPLALPIPARHTVLAVGAHLKNTLTLASHGDAFVSQHIGDLETLETTAHWRRTLEAFSSFFGIEPRVIARDLHPGYLSTQLAAELAPSVERVFTIQHHHAHVAAVAAEHRVTEPVIGVAFDGTGMGDDGRIWGAELLIADLNGYRRVGQLRYAPLPGGDLAVRTPWRTAFGYLSLLPDTVETRTAFAFAVNGVPEKEQELVMQQAERGINAPEASSMGRLFDAAAALLGVCRVARFEGEAAMRLESLAANHAGRELPFPIAPAASERLVLDPLPLLLALGESLARGADVAELAASFHESVAAATAAAVRRVAQESGINTVVLSGGVFQNARLLAGLRHRLRRAALRVLLARHLPPNDGAISYGQAAIASALMEREASVA